MINFKLKFNVAVTFVTAIFFVYACGQESNPTKIIMNVENNSNSIIDIKLKAMIEKNFHKLVSP